MQAYPGTNPVTPWISYTFTPGYGLWPTPLNATDGDDRFAAQLMAAVQALADRANLLGWRVAYLNPIDGSTSTFTATISTKNGWSFTGACEVASTGTWRFKGNAYLQNGKTFNVGDTGAGGLGHVVVNPGSDINLDGSGGSTADIIGTGANARIQLTGGGLLQTTASGIARFQGDTYEGLNGDASTSTTVYHPTVYSGDAAVQKLRKKTLPSGGGSFTASEADIWVLPTTLAGITLWTPVAETGDFAYIVQQSAPGSQAFNGSIVIDSHNVQFNAVTSGGIVAYGAATIRHNSATNTHRLVSYFDAAGVTGNSFGPLVTL